MLSFYYSHKIPEEILSIKDLYNAALLLRIYMHDFLPHYFWMVVA